jgi:fructose/tagatose bisphosphate aldolase
MLDRGPEALQRAREHGVAIPGFTTYTLESTRAICDAGTDASLPVILQAGSSSFSGVGRSMLARAALTMAEESPSPVGVHLDHSTDLAEIRACIVRRLASIL